MSQNSLVPDGNLDNLRPALVRAASNFTNAPLPPVTAPSFTGDLTETIDGVLELADGSAYCGISFGAEMKSVSGECVFQTGSMRLQRVFWLVSYNHPRHGWIYRVAH